MNVMERVRFFEIKGRISWGSIIAGVITVIAVSILLSILGSSIGLFMFDPASAHPTSGIGTTMGVWTVVSLLISLGLGGFVAGKLAGADGMIHGFVVWATTFIVTVIFVVMLAVSTVKLAVNILGSVSSVAGNVVSGVGSAVGSGVSELGDQVGDLFGDIDFSDEMNGDEVRQDIRQALRKSGVKEFQPEYLQKEFKGVKSDLQKSVKKLVTNPNDADKIANAFLERVKTRTDEAFQDVNRDDLTKAIANNSSMSKAEVDKAVDEYIVLINKAKMEGKEQIANLEQSIENAKQEWQVMKQNALEEADKATNSAATSGIISFIAMLIGAILCSYMGFMGTRKTREGYEA